MEIENSELDSLIVKKLTNTLSAEEEVRLNTLLRENPIAQDYYNSYARLWETSGHVKLQKGLSRDIRWSNLQTRIQNDQTEKSGPSLRILMRYAAIFGAVVMVAVIYLLSQQTSSIEIKTAYGETKTVTLPDESLVMLNAGTTLRYDPSSWDEERKLDLEGEAYFDVKTNGVPFIVVSDNATVEVMGTTFNVRAREQMASVVCVSGKVRVSKKEEDPQAAILTKGLGVTIDEGILSPVSIVNDAEAIAWVSGDLHFDEVPLKNVFSEIERHFNKSITFKKDIPLKTFTGSFKNPQFEKTLQVVCLSAGLTYSTEKDTTIVIQ